MFKMKLTDRQLHELAFYERFYRMRNILEISFDPVIGEERRPWNSYWYLYDFVRSNFKSKNQRLVNIGCGQGIESVRLAKIGYEVWAFDISPRGIYQAKRLSKKYDLSTRTHFSLQLAERVNYPDDFFDIAVGINILHHTDIEKLLKECHRVLKNGGHAIFREHIEVPNFDRFRNMKYVKSLFPKDKSFEKHITIDERKLNYKDIAMAGKIFSNLYTERFSMLSRLDYFTREGSDNRPSFLEQVDYFLFRIFPKLKNLGGGIVLKMEK